MATKIKKSEFAGAGMFIQLVGIVCFLLAWETGPVGLVVFGILGMLLLIAGGRRALVILCSECRGKVEKKARICPHCRSEFEGKSEAARGKNPSWADSLK